MGLAFVICSSLHGGMWDQDFESPFDYMAESIQSIVDAMKQASSNARMHGAGMLSGKRACSITQTDDEVILMVPMSGLKEEDIRAEVVDHTFNLVAKTEQMAVKVTIDGEHAQVHVQSKGSKATQADGQQEESRMVFASEQNIIETLPAQVVVEGDAPISVHFDEKVLEIHCAKVKKAIQKVMIHKKESAESAQ